MVFHHRNLIQDSIDLNTTTQICDFFCVYNKFDGNCPRSCLSVCPPICYRPFTLVQFPPTSLPDTNPNLHHKNNLTNLHFYLSFSFALLATVLFLFVGFSIYKHFRIRRSSTSPDNREERGDRDPHENDHDRDEFMDEENGPVIDHPIWYIRTVGLQPSIINAISVCKYKKSDGIVEGTECSVCLNEFEEDETLRLLPKCSHAFHIPCIDTWLRSHTNCPNCRRAVIFSPPVPVPAPAAAQETAGIPTILEESESETVSESGPLDIENEIREEGDEDFHPIRRSVSASIMSAGTQMENSVVTKKIKLSPSLIRLMGGGGGAGGVIRPCLAKRSFSCSGKVFLSRYCPNRISNLPCSCQGIVQIGSQICLVEGRKEGL